MDRLEQWPVCRVYDAEEGHVDWGKTCAFMFPPQPCSTLVEYLEGSLLIREWNAGDVRKILEKGTRGASRVHLEVLRGDRNEVRRLCHHTSADSPATMDALDDSGRSPLTWAVLLGDVLMCHTLCALGARVRACGSPLPTPLHYAVGVEEYGSFAVFRSMRRSCLSDDDELRARICDVLLTSRDADVDECMSGTGLTPLMLACRNAFPRCVRTLLAARADADASLWHDPDVSVLDLGLPLNMLSISIRRDYDVSRLMSTDYARDAHADTIARREECLRAVCVSPTLSDATFRKWFSHVTKSRNAYWVELAMRLTELRRDVRVRDCRGLTAAALTDDALSDDPVITPSASSVR